ncbi:unnamed protein product [Musa acuminata subsp. malaccensis]|uniref:(wild Malaysian banana) hypothetical protein n=1 Tax=Musa acuminata subsp. malaccensis TaxID=214687 RepID=A0A804LAP7_MUSAM|nr:PREDICTED: uncharacterized protein LOC103972263 [Musa acuminata subsp. malaccensis]CAG1865340.1 unnamed protein product [Musa acuminata subsp. malaccensis]
MEADWFRTQQGFRSRRRGRRRERAYRVGGGVLRVSGCDYLMEQRNGLEMESESTCSSSFQKEEDYSCQSPYDKTSVKPSEKHMDQETTREAEIRWSSPSIIAKLMGLDEQPPVQEVNKQKKVINDCFQEISAVGLQDKYLRREEHSPWMSTTEHQGFKDVYDVTETRKVEREKKKPDNKALPSLKQYKFDVNKQFKPDVSSVDQSFMGVKQFHSDKSQRTFIKSNNRLADHDCKKHHFFKAFQEPNFLFKKYFHDLKWLAPSHLTSKIAIFKSSSGAKIESDKVCCPSERKTDGFTNLLNDVMITFRKPVTGMVGHSLKEHNDSLLQKSAGNSNPCVHPNHIVLLKPSTNKAHSKGRSVLETPKVIQFADRRLTTQTVFQEPDNVEREWSNFSHNMEDFGCKTKGLREISREITEQPKDSKSSSNKHVSVLGLNRFSRDESSCIMPGANNLCNSEASCRPSNRCNYWNSTYGSSATSTEVRRESSKNLSRKWKVTDHIKEVGDCGKGSSTLAEMFALSDLETQNPAPGSSMVHTVSDEKLSKLDMRAPWGSPSSISSRDSWVDGFFINLPKSTALPASSTNYGSRNLSSMHRFGVEHFGTFHDMLRPRQKKCIPRESSSLKSIKSGNLKLYSNFGREENNLPSKEIHMNQERMRKGALCETPAELNFERTSVPHSADVHMSITDQELAQPTMTHMILMNPKFSSPNLKEAPTDGSQLYIELLTPVRTKEASQPCPVSVLDLPVREDDLGCPKILNGGLLELNTKTLPSESGDPCAEASEVITLSNEDDSEDCQSIQQNSYLEEEFMDEEERDYTYLLDILIVSGVHSAKQGKLCNACYSPEHPVKPTLFEKLERKYSKLVAWSHSERRLMFDLTNSTLAEILAPCMDRHPWVNSTRRIAPMWGSEGLVEKTWQMLVEKRMELSGGNAEDKVLDIKWLDLGDDIDEVGVEIERTLKEELLEELVVEFMAG